MITFVSAFVFTISQILNCLIEEECRNESISSLLDRFSSSFFSSYYPFFLGAIFYELVIKSIQKVLFYFWCKYVLGRRDTRFSWPQFFWDDDRPSEPREIEVAPEAEMEIFRQNNDPQEIPQM